jgi:lysophospholipase
MYFLTLSLFVASCSALRAYTPVPAVCPSGSLVRDASGLSDEEETYRVGRKAVADVALKSWLEKTDSGFSTSGELPTVILCLKIFTLASSNVEQIAMTSSGGGLRSFLISAGVVKAFDARDSNASTSGLYQALTYHAGLSGGGWLVSGLSGNNWPTISSMVDSMWRMTIRDSLLVPEFLLAAAAYGEILTDVAEKDAAGFNTTIVDAYGRLLEYQFIRGADDSLPFTLSSLTTLSNFTSYAAPYPILTATGAKVWEGECKPGPNGTTYELTPYEFGSWDSDVSAFAQTKYLGTPMSAGKPAQLTCTENYDNLGLGMSTTSNIFPNICADAPNFDGSAIAEALEDIVNKIHETTTSDLYALYSNPFYNYKSPSQIPNSENDISAQKTLSLGDGSLNLQNNPIFPMLQPARNISVMIVNDNSDDTKTNYPNGSEILTSYVQSFNHGLTRMPFIPPTEDIIAKNLTTRAIFFGCDDVSKITLIWIPNADYTFNSGTNTAQLAYSEKDTDSMIANGVEVATQGGDASWATCLACGIMLKTGDALPSTCTACLDEYCWSA